MIQDHVKYLFLEQLILENLLYLVIYINLFINNFKIMKNLMLKYLIVHNMNRKVEKLHKFVII